MCSLPAWRLLPSPQLTVGSVVEIWPECEENVFNWPSPTSLAWPICSTVLCLKDNAIAVGCATITSRGQKKSDSVVSSSYNFLLMICWFYFRNAHFSCSLWPRLRPIGSQGILQSVYFSYFCFRATYKKFDNIMPVQVRGTTKYHLSPHEQKAFAGAISTGVPNTLWRIRFSRFLTYFECCP